MEKVSPIMLVNRKEFSAFIASNGIDEVLTGWSWRLRTSLSTPAHSGENRSLE